MPVLDVKKLAHKARKTASHWRPRFLILKLSDNKRSSARRWEIRLFRLSFTVSLRRFRTKPANRSKLQTHLVVRLYFTPYKEIALTSNKRRKLAKNTRQDISKFKYFSHLSPITAILFVIGVVGAAYFGSKVYGPTNLDIKSADTGIIRSTTIVKPAPPLSLPSSLPKEIQIPRIWVDAPVYPDGLQPDGTLLPPADYTTTGWYTGSPTPGQLGASIIVGHVDHVGGIGVFWDLRLLQPGDEIDIIRADGTTAKFTVNALREYPESNFPTQLVYGSVNYAGLRLITCGGIFSETTHRYSNNIVIFASLVS